MQAKTVARVYAGLVVWLALFATSRSLAAEGDAARPDKPPPERQVAPGDRGAKQAEPSQANSFETPLTRLLLAVAGPLVVFLLRLLIVRRGGEGRQRARSSTGPRFMPPWERWLREGSHKRDSTKFRRARVQLLGCSSRAKP
jgi:hypothetical protein